MIAAVRVRGDLDTRKKVSDTLENLNLEKRNQLVLYEDTDAIRGMLNLAKDYITFGEIDDDTLEELEERAGRDLGAGDTVNLSPPSGGFENTKKQVGQGGSLGERGNMDSLIQAMV